LFRRLIYLMKFSAGMKLLSSPLMWLMLSSSRAQLLEALAGSMARRKGNAIHPPMITAITACAHSGVVSVKKNLTVRKNPRATHTSPIMTTPTLRPQPSLNVGSVLRTSSKTGASTSGRHVCKSIEPPSLRSRSATARALPLATATGAAVRADAALREYHQRKSVGKKDTK